jgi:hypothetical protein
MVLVEAVRRSTHRYVPARLIPTCNGDISESARNYWRSRMFVTGESDECDIEDNAGNEGSAGTT